MGQNSRSQNVTTHNNSKFDFGAFFWGPYEPWPIIKWTSATIRQVNTEI